LPRPAAGRQLVGPRAQAAARVAALRSARGRRVVERAAVDHLPLDQRLDAPAAEALAQRAFEREVRGDARLLLLLGRTFLRGRSARVGPAHAHLAAQHVVVGIELRPPDRLGIAGGEALARRAGHAVRLVLDAPVAEAGLGDGRIRERLERDLRAALVG